MALTRNERIVDLWEYGLATSAIAERLGVGQATVRIVLKSAGYNLAASPRTRYDGAVGGIGRPTRRAVLAE